MVFVVILLVLLLLIAYMVKLNHDLFVNKDNILRSMAALDAAIIKKNLAVLDLLGYAQGIMEKEANLIKELFNIRHDINKITPKIANATERYEMQANFDKKITTFINAAARYPELNKNMGFQKSLQNYTELENACNERIDYFNQCIDNLNWSINSFPSSILAQLDNTKEPPPHYQK